jgi:hypothetical protein
MAGPEESPVLIVQSGPLSGQRWTIPQEGLVLGRGDDCDVAIPDRQISRHHLRVYRREGVPILKDMGSKNGTWVNGQAVDGEIELSDGDVIQVALVLQVVFVASDSTVPLTLDGGLAQAGRLHIDPRAHKVWIGETEIDPPLSVHQYRLLELLYLRSGAVVSREEVVESVWPGVSTDGVSEQAIDALVRRLRDRLAEVDKEWDYIVTVRGHGFRLNSGT